MDRFVQQWTATQSAHGAGLSSSEVWVYYLGAGGSLDEVEVHGYLAGLMMIPGEQRDLVADAINELIETRESPVDGAHYSTGDVAAESGFEDYLRPLVTTPDGYRFDRPPIMGFHAGGVDEAPVGTDREGLEQDAEMRRCQALYDSGMLETGREERFDRITAFAQKRFGVSSASISLITENRQIIKSVTGPIGEDLPRELSLCAITIEKNRTLVISNAGTDPAYREHPLVAGGPEARFYAGHPVSTADGWRIGTLCLIDDRPRTFTDDDEVDLQRLAAQVQIEMWLSPGR